MVRSKGGEVVSFRGSYGEGSTLVSKYKYVFECVSV